MRAKFPSLRPAVMMAVAACSIVAVTPGADVRVTGSDLLGAEFSRALYAFAGREGVSVALALDGSQSGLDELKAGRSQLALGVFPSGENAEVAAFDRVTVAYCRVVVLAPAAVPIDRITLAQLAGVFGVGGALSVSEWGGLGAEGAWRTASIAPQVPAASAGVVAEYFRRVALAGRPFRPNVARYARLADLAASFEGDSRTLALAPADLTGDARAKLLAVAVRPGAPAFLPTLENIHAGDYPLRLPLVAVHRREPAAAVRAVLRFMMGDDAAAAFARAQLAPLPASVRRQRQAALETP